MGRIYGSAAVQRAHDELIDLVRLAGHDGDLFAHVDAFDDAVHHKGLGQQAQHAVQACAHAVQPAGKQRDAEIRNEQRLADLQTRVFGKDHGNDVGAAAGGADVKNNSAARRRQDNGVAQLQERVVRKRAGHGHGALQHPDIERERHRRVKRGPDDRAPQNHQPQHDEHAVDDKHERAHIHMRQQRGRDDGDAGRTTHCKIIG